MRQLLFHLAIITMSLTCLQANEEKKPVKQPKKRKAPPADLVRTPLVPVDINQLPEGIERLDIFLLIGQSNMKGRGKMPANPLSDPRVMMMHKGTDRFFEARHPLHLVGDPETFAGADNAGVGPGLAFARTLIAKDSAAAILLIPCAVGGTKIASWQKGMRLYEDAVRRATLAVKLAPKGKSQIAGALWLQGEADSGSPERIAAYPKLLDQMISDLRSDLARPDLPFIACTIGELKPDSEGRKEINGILLDLPKRVRHSDCVDSRAFAKSIGDNVHFDTATQNEHGRLFAKKYLGVR